MKVTLLAHTPEPEKIVAAAARCCYSNDDPNALLEAMTDEQATKFLKKLGDLGHQSPLEHVSFTFAISGVSRSLLAQITRHRLASFSVRSQRYCNFNESDFVKPPKISKSPQVEEIFDLSLAKSKADYDKLIEAGIPKEDARMVLPNAASTSMVLTMNARELLHFFNLRCCCYDDKTEVMTDQGWKFFKDLDRTELFLTMNPITYEESYVKAVNYIDEYYEGQLTHIDCGKYFDIAVSENHKIYAGFNEEYFSLQDVMKINSCKWMIFFLEDKGVKMNVNEQHIDMIDYEGHIYCVELEKYFLLFVRRNGVGGVWCGNSRAQWEIRALANMMVNLVKEVAPTIFEKAGASCVQLGYCPENKFSCGKAPTLDEILKAYVDK